MLFLRSINVITDIGGNMANSYLNIETSGSTIAAGLIGTEVIARRKSKGNPKLREYYRQRKLIGSTDVVPDFIVKHPQIFGNEKLIMGSGSTEDSNKRGSFLDDLLALSPLAGTERFADTLQARAEYSYGLTQQELKAIPQFCEDFAKLVSSPEMQGIVKDTQQYQNSIAELWSSNEKIIMEYIGRVLGNPPEITGKVNAYIMYPVDDVHRTHSLGGNKSNLFFAQRDETDPCKILAFLSHHAVHQPMLPYKPHMTQAAKERFHAFIKFLTDKDVYNQLSGKSYLDIKTKDENTVIMGAMYPFWLGYRYRNSDKDGGNAVEEIRAAIARDKSYYDKLPINSELREFYSTYKFEKYDPEKIAMLFREKRGITPYQFAELDFSQVQMIWKDRYLTPKNNALGVPEYR